MAGSHITWPAWGLWLLFAGSLVAATLLFVLVRTDLRIVGVVGVGVLVGIIVVSLAFAWRYHVYIDATFGVRRLRKSSSLGLILLALGVLEGLLMLLGRSRPRLAMGVAVATVVSLTVWLLPSVGSRELDHLSQERTRVISWVRARTPCDARLLVNQRTEGTLAALTGRFGLLEGMGPFLRVDELPYVVNLLLSARSFFHSPLSHEAFLRRHDISYVVVAKVGQLLGYQAPLGKTDIRALNAAPFLRRVLATRSVLVYRVMGAPALPISPLLKGPYLHCLKAPVHF